MKKLFVGQRNKTIFKLNPKHIKISDFIKDFGMIITYGNWCFHLNFSSYYYSLSLRKLTFYVLTMHLLCQKKSFCIISFFIQNFIQFKRLDKNGHMNIRKSVLRRDILTDWVYSVMFLVIIESSSLRFHNFFRNF